MDSEKIKIRLATIKDVDKILKLAEDWHPIHNEYEYKIRRETLQELLIKQKCEIFIAEINEEIIGWFDVKVYKDWYMLRYSVHVEHILVASNYRNKGVGSEILQRIIEHHEKKGIQTNMNIIFFYSEGDVDRFFEKNGFYVSPQHFYIRKKRVGDKRPLGVD